MRRCTFLLLAAGLLCLVLNNAVMAQEAAADSGAQQNAVKNSLALFYASIGKQSPLFNGTEYYLYDPIIKGNAYYADVNAFTSGSVTFNNMRFNGVPMLYDIYGDQVVVLLYNHLTRFCLVKDKVANFDFLDHHFIRVDTVTFMNNPVIKPGYYDELYGGHTEVLAKSSKNIQTTASSATNEMYFNEEKTYFVRKDNVYYTFSSQGGLLDILKDRKKDLQKYIKSNQIKYRRNPEEAMVKIASYYDQLTK